MSTEESDSLPGKPERVHEVLNRKRPLSLKMIRRLHKGLGIPAESLIGSKMSESVPRTHATG